jgi:hypothetical protein
MVIRIGQHCDPWEDTCPVSLQDVREVGSRAQTGTMFEGLRKPKDLIVIVVKLVAYGCPIQAIVQAFGLDERTVASWRDRAELPFPILPVSANSNKRGERSFNMLFDFVHQLGESYHTLAHFRPSSFANQLREKFCLFTFAPNSF